MKETTDSPVSVTSAPNKVQLSSEGKTSGQFLSQVLETDSLEAQSAKNQKDKFLLEGNSP
jgi:hypothetical protein